jgi:hypothetical protein
MTRQRIERTGAPAGGSMDLDLVDGTSAALDREAVRDPAQLRSGLERIDPRGRAGAMHRLQAGIGNAARTAQRLSPHGVQQVVGPSVVQRDGDDPVGGDQPFDGAQQLDAKAGAGGGATEVIGPPSSSTYAVSGSSLDDVSTFISTRDEAGHVGWVEDMAASGSNGSTLDTVSVTVAISLEMPSWTPPSTMLPKARAEWTRWYAALAAHEQGHIKLVHDVHDGLAKKLLGKTPRAADTLFDAAKASLTAKSKAYDTATGHGLKTGTIIDVGIEQQELADEQKKKDDAAKAKTRDSAVPSVPDDE